MKKIFTTLVVILSSQFTFAISESVLMTQLNTEIVPYFEYQYQKNEFKGSEGISIKYYSRKVAQPAGVIIFSPGQSEASIKYSEFLFDIKNLNYDIYIIDHRGQGLSGRLLPDPVKSHVDRFQNYVADLQYLINDIVHPEKYQKSILMAHSMGGAIATGYLIQNPNKITSAILMAPMLQVNTGSFNNLSADVVATAVDFLGFGDRYAPTQKPYNPQSRFEQNRETSSYERFLMKKNIYNQRPQIQVGGTTYRWLKESLQFTVALRTSQPDLLKTPTVIFQAGADLYVEAYGQNRFCEELNATQCRIIRNGFEGSQHEILMEHDSIRSRAIEIILNLIQSMPSTAQNKALYSE